MLFREFTILLVYHKVWGWKTSICAYHPPLPTNQQSKFDCEAKRKNIALKAKGEALFIISIKLIKKKTSRIERRKNEEKRWCLLQVYYYFENIQCKIKITWFNQSKINKDKLIERKGLNYNTCNPMEAARKEYTIETISK